MLRENRGAIVLYIGRRGRPVKPENLLISQSHIINKISVKHNLMDLHVEILQLGVLGFNL